MKILLLHPNDRAEDGPWRNLGWDWIVDLGWAGHRAYARLADRFRCRAFSIRSVSDHEFHRSRLRELWQPDFHQLMDAEGVDWWDIFFPLPYAQMEQVVLVSTLAAEIPKDVPCFLCHWFDGSWYEYGTQFAKFSAGHILSSPEAILDIPERLQGIEITPSILQRRVTEIRPSELQAVLSGAPSG